MLCSYHLHSVLGEGGRGHWALIQDIGWVGGGGIFSLFDPGEPLKSGSTDLHTNHWSQWRCHRMYTICFARLALWLYPQFWGRAVQGPGHSFWIWVGEGMPQPGEPLLWWLIAKSNLIQWDVSIAFNNTSGLHGHPLLGLLGMFHRRAQNIKLSVHKTFTFQEGKKDEWIMNDNWQWIANRNALNELILDPLHLWNFPHTVDSCYNKLLGPSKITLLYRNFVISGMQKQNIK